MGNLAKNGLVRLTFAARAGIHLFFTSPVPLVKPEKPHIIAMTASAPPKSITAALLVIGDEILSGRTKDKNIGTIADFCTGMGIELCEVRVVSDETDDIVAALNALRVRYTYVFTTGGIGPTHDDITADAVAKAFGVDLPINEEARRILEERFQTVDVSPERLRMARVPVGATLIKNIVSGAPGFVMDNVHVMAGVPRIMQAMLEDVASTLQSGAKMHSRAIKCGVGESTVSAGLGALQEEYPTVKMGSYPTMGRLPIYTELVLRATDEALLDEAAEKVRAMVNAIHAEKGIVLPEETNK